MKKISRTITSTFTILLLIPFVAMALSQVNGLGTGTLTVDHDETVVTAFLYDGTYYDASTANPWNDNASWSSNFTAEADSIKFIDDVNACYAGALDYDTCIGGGGVAIDNTCGYYFSGGIWNEDTSCGGGGGGGSGTTTSTSTLSSISTITDVITLLLLSFLSGLIMSIWIFKSYILS